METEPLQKRKLHTNSGTDKLKATEVGKRGVGANREGYG
uniref:Uncharacterized protein n=1 Tax=Arundo donax TaxID=35708 RepID=A0A0A9GRZ5_ARUDO